MGSLKTLVTRLVPFHRVPEPLRCNIVTKKKMVVLHTRSVHTQTSNLGLHSLSISLQRQSQKCLWSSKSLLGRNAASAHPRQGRAKKKIYAHRTKIVWCIESCPPPDDHLWCSFEVNATQIHAHKHYLSCVYCEIQTLSCIFFQIHIHTNINICKKKHNLGQRLNFVPGACW